MSKSLSIALVSIAFIIGIGVGYMISPYYEMMNYKKNTMADLGKPDKYLDLRYLDAMISHHESVMVLATQAKQYSKRDEIITIADSILKEEPEAIDELYKYKKDWFQNTYKVKPSEVPNLGTYDEKFDLRFLNALVAHHQDGIDMAKEIKKKSVRNEVLNNAQEVEDFLSANLDSLLELRQDWYEI